MPTPTTLQDQIAVYQKLVAYQIHPPIQDGVLFDRVKNAIPAAYFLFSEGTAENSVHRFINHTLPQLIGQLTRSTESQRRTYQGQVRGRILWASTIKARHTDDYNPTRYVCAEVHHRYDTPENQLLKYMMERLSACLKAIPTGVREGLYFHPDKEGVIGDSPPDPIGPFLGTLETSLNRVWRNVRLGQINTPTNITEQHLLRANTAHLEQYKQVAALYRRYEQTVLNPSWETLAKIGAHILLLPANTLPPHDPWIQFSAALLQHQGRS